MLKKNATAINDDTFIVDQLNSFFAKIKITDKSIDKDEIQRQLIDYYQAKFGNPDLADFQYDFIDLFCGAGGLSVGLEQEGFRPVVAVDKDQSAILTYRFNRPWLTDGSIIHDDIRDLVGQDIFPHVPVIVGGPPCQGFSVVNKHKKENDERNGLYKFYVHSVEQALPDVFLMENVEGILQLYGKIKKDFSKVGYITCEPLVFNTKDFLRAGNERLYWGLRKIIRRFQVNCIGCSRQNCSGIWRKWMYLLYGMQSRTYLRWKQRP